VNQNFVQDAIIGLLIFAIATSVMAVVFWIFFLVGLPFFPNILVFHQSSVNLIVLGSLLGGLFAVLLIYPGVYSSTVNQLIFFLLLVVGIMLGTQFGRSMNFDQRLQPQPNPEEMVNTLNGRFFWDASGSAVFKSHFTEKIQYFQEVGFDSIYQRFLSTQPNEGVQPELNWIGNSTSYFMPPQLLIDTLADLHAISSIMRRFSQNPKDLTNLIVFFLGFFFVVAFFRLIIQFQLPHLLTAIASLFFVRLGIALIRFSWLDSLLILSQWIDDLDISYTWLYSGWMPLGLGLSLFFISLYQHSISKLGNDEDHAS
jgi:Ca2+/Na+ antiporter